MDPTATSGGTCTTGKHEQGLPHDVPATAPAQVADTPAASLLPSFDDADSGYAPSIAATDTTSLASSIARYREENGRTYHSYGVHEHWGPNDDKAQDQQDLSHQLWTLALKGRHYLCPLREPRQILDIGTGTGIWAIEVGDLHPDAEVTGTDLSPIQPTWVPPNVMFEIDDFNLDWIDQDKFDLIHARELLGSCPDWPSVYKQVLAALKPGGFYEQHEPSLFFTSDVVTLESDHPFRQWGEMMTQAGRAAGMHFDIGDKLTKDGWRKQDLSMWSSIGCLGWSEAGPRTSISVQWDNGISYDWILVWQTFVPGDLRIR